MSDEKIKLQQYGFQDSQYERPNQPWVCGRLCDGKPCHIGPDAKGHCLATADCMPVKKGDRWHCTRPPSRGGTCPTGPLPDGSCCRPVEPCQPVRSVRSRRGQVVFWTVAASLGVLAFMLFGPSRMAFIQPGELSNAHGQVLKDFSTAACFKCHTAAGGTDKAGSTPDSWIRSSFATVEVAAAESKNCLACHSNTPGLRENPLNPHSFDVAALAQKHKKAKPAEKTPVRWLLARLGPDVPVSADNQLACATCHIEHRGQDHLLAHMSNQQCQACHTSKFTSFSSGHPEFNRFPYERRTRLAFDHEGHTRYFQQKTREFSCSACHQADVSERHMMTVKFENACASCHALPMENPSKGLLVLHLPGIDVDTLKEFAQEGGPWIGAWPKGADYDIDGKLSPFMRLLLASDPAVAQAMAMLPPKMQLNDLTSATKDQKVAVVRIVWGVKELFHDLATRGQNSLRERLSKSLAVDLSNRQIADLTAELSADAVVLAQQKWLPDVLQTVPIYRAGKPMPGAPQVKPKAVAPVAVVTPPPTKPGGNIFDEEDDLPPKPPVAVVTPPITPPRVTPTPPITPVKPKPAGLFDDDDDKDAVVLLPVPPKTVIPALTPKPPVDPVKPPVDPVKPPVDPIKPPVDPVKPQVDPVKPPVDPIKPPVDPIKPKPPVDPIKPPVDPVKPPVDPVKPSVNPAVIEVDKPLPVEPVKRPPDQKGGSLLDDSDELRPKQPLVPVKVTPPIDPVKPPIDPIKPPIDPVKPPVDPIKPPVDPVKPPVDPIKPPIDPVKPPVDPIKPPIDPVKPPVDPIKPPIDPVKPPVDPIKPPVDPVKPPVDPIKPPIDPVKPPVDPIKPPVDPVKPPVDPIRPPVKPVDPPPVAPPPKGPLLDDTKPSEPQPYARITAYRGSVQYRLSDSKPWRWADVGTPLPVTAQIRTGLNSTVTVVVLPDARTTVDKMKVVNIRDMSTKSGSWLPTPRFYDETRVAAADAPAAAPTAAESTHLAPRDEDRAATTVALTAAHLRDRDNADEVVFTASATDARDSAIDPLLDDSTKPMRVVSIKGRVEYRPNEQARWRPVVVAETLEETGDLRTGLNSAIKLNDGERSFTMDRLGVVRVAALRTANVKSDIGMKYGRTTYHVEQNVEPLSLIRRSPTTLIIGRSGDHRAFNPPAFDVESYFLDSIYTWHSPFLKVKEYEERRRANMGYPPVSPSLTPLRPAGPSPKGKLLDDASPQRSPRGADQGVDAAAGNQVYTSRVATTASTTIHRACQGHSEMISFTSTAAPASLLPPQDAQPDRDALLDDSLDIARAQAAYVKVLKVSGTVQFRATSASQWQPLTVGEWLDDAAEVRVGLQSQAKMIAGDRLVSIDRIGSIKVIAMRKMIGIVKSDVGLKYGRVRYRVEPADDGKFTQPATFQVRGSVNDAIDEHEPLMFVCRSVTLDGITRVMSLEQSEAAPAPREVFVSSIGRVVEPVFNTVLSLAQPAPKKGGDLFNEDDEEKPAAKDKDKTKAKQPAPSTPAKKGGDLFNEDDEEKPAKDKDKAKPAAPPAAKGNIFDDDEDIKSPPKATTPKPPAKGIFDEDDDVKPKPPTTPGTAAPSTAAPALAPSTPLLPPEQRVSAGGWYMDEGAFAIRYRPVGHANPFLRQWLTLTAGAAAAPRKVPHSAGKIAFDAMRTDVGATCVKCHSIDEHPDHKEPGAIEKVFSWADPAGAGHGPLVINWQAKQPAVDYRPFVKFNHRPHRSLPELQDCKVCHSVIKGEVTAKYQTLDPYDYTAKQVGFQPVSREKCATCHQQNLAGDSCLKCHNYHISDILQR